MKLFEKIRLNRAKRNLNKALKIVSKLSWEELDSIMPKTNYEQCFDVKKGVKGDWRKVHFKYPYLCSEGERKDT